MKHIIIAVIMLVQSMVVCAQLNLGAGYGHTVGGGSNENWNCYNIVDVSVGKTWHFRQGWQLNPEFSLYTLWNKMDDKTATDVYTKKINTFGAGLGFYASKGVVAGLSIFTGPNGRCNFVQKEKSIFYKLSDKDNKSIDSHDYHAHRAILMWKFGLQYDFSQIRLRASYDLQVTKYSVKYYGGPATPTYNTISASIAWKL